MNPHHEQVPDTSTTELQPTPSVGGIVDPLVDEQIPDPPAAGEQTHATEQEESPGDRSLNLLSSMDALISRPAKRHGRVTFWLAVAWVAMIVFCASFANLLPLEPYDVILDDLPPRVAPRLSFNEPLGTDDLGRSTTSRVIFSARQSLPIGIVSVGVAMLVGLTIGMTAGYLKGRVDSVFGVILDAMLSVPGLVTLLAVASVGKRDITTVAIGLSIVFTPTFARLARASTLALSEREFVTAARAMGASHRRIIVRELLPNVILPISSYVFLMLAVAIVAEGSLSFLGLGIPPPAPSWGGMVNSGRQFLHADPFLVFVPSACLLLTVLSFTIIGDRARRRYGTRQSALS